jgi:sugar lactone lactonase YvrE
MGICLDHSGNVIFADNGNSVIRKINKTTGIITTIAGNGLATYSGDGGPALNASFNGPTGICMDAAGNLYVADAGNGYVRKVQAGTNIVTKIAGNGGLAFDNDGGPALNAGLGDVDGICIDGHGDIYIDDISCSCRKINMTTGIINVVAGDGVSYGYNGDGGSATTELLFDPAGLCVDPANGNIIIADEANNRIRRTTQPGYIPTGVSNTTVVSGLKIYPNPSTGIFNIQTGSQVTNAVVEVMNFVGSTVRTVKLSGSKNISISAISRQVFTM